jgi:protein TonB
MQSDLLDILFENRNKTYGAYALRRSYNKTMASATSITLFIVTVFSVIQPIHHAKQRDVMHQVIITPDNVFTKLDPVKALPGNPAPKRIETHTRQIVSSPPLIVNDLPKTQLPTIDEIDKSMIGTTSINGGDATEEVQPIERIRENTGTGATQAIEIKPDDSPVTWAQVMPEYPGGLDALKKFMLRNLKQPDDLQPDEKVIVMASFVVNKNGRIEQVKIVNSGRPDLDKEVQRVINKMPLWKPGMQNGNVVAVYFNLPVTFMSEEE